MSRADLLERRRMRLIEELVDTMSFLIGSVSSKGLASEAYNLTTKVDGVTRTKHIPKDLVALTRQMTKRHKKVKEILKKRKNTWNFSTTLTKKLRIL